MGRAVDSHVVARATLTHPLAHAFGEHRSPIGYARRRELFTNSTVTLDLDAHGPGARRPGGGLIPL
ncbi:hypothetical protein P1P68_11445 [Streptomyces scabiei]|uniref:hypothetical protein n=1 Tax=Streptomyces scabiei TaxID=1930 RepID=UPI00298F9474|nr:hypothetical protein [Streptomyces scabiei]MDW8805374.1 hypothetical protein [Streptomyces scabiei]